MPKSHQQMYLISHNSGCYSAHTDILQQAENEDTSGEEVTLDSGSYL